MLRISIITPSFNQAAYLEETLRSVRDQRYPDLEHLVLDGGSTDGTPAILRQWDKALAYWVSEPDHGQSHAINKGLARASGEVVAYLNSDDLYLPGALAFVNEFFTSHPEAQWLCGAVIGFGDGRRPADVLKSRCPASLARHLLTPWHFWQQGIFWRRSVTEKQGLFDERLHYVMDHEYWTRLLVAGYRPACVDQPLAAMRSHPLSKSCRQARRFDREIRRVRKAYAPRLSAPERKELQFLLRRHLARRLTVRTADRRSAEGWRRLIRSLRLYPGGVFERSTWNAVRRLLRIGEGRK